MMAEHRIDHVGGVGGLCSTSITKLGGHARGEIG
jgi:hypothetical protein